MAKSTMYTKITKRSLKLILQTVNSAEQHRTFHRGRGMKWNYLQVIADQTLSALLFQRRTSCWKSAAIVLSKVAALPFTELVRLHNQ